MRKKNKLITLLLLFTLSFSTVFHVKTKEVDGAMVGTAIFLAGVKYSAFAGFATLFYVNGYHMQISDLAIKFANTYYDYANGKYIEKAGAMNALDKFNLYASSLLSGNLDNNISLEELNILKDSIVAYNPRFVSMNNLSFYDYSSSTGNIYTNNQGFYKTNSEYENKIFKITSTPIEYEDYFVYLDFTNYGWNEKNGFYFPTYRLIKPTGETKLLKILDLSKPSLEPYLSEQEMLFMIGGAGSWVKRDNYIDVGNTEIMPTIIENSFANSNNDFIYGYPNWYGALNGTTATNTEELIGLMNTDEYLQREINKLLEKQKVNDKNTLVSPVINPGGVINYPVTEDLPDNPPNTGATDKWYNDIFGLLANVPDLIIGGTTDLINNNVVPAINSINNTLSPAINTIKDTVNSIPALITNVWDTTIDVPMESINFDKLKLNGFTTKFPFSIPFDYVRIISVLNVSPIEPDLAITLNTKYLKVNHAINSNFINKFIVFFRWFVLLTFIIGLMMITRKVIKW